jgi:predicted nucleic acid-binding Zn ribbon protein
MRRGGRGTSSVDRERDPSPIGDAVRQLVSERGWDEQLALGRLKENWATVVGRQVAARSQPTRLENGRLTIRVEGGAWAAELALIGQSLATAAGRFLGSGLVREVAVVGGHIRSS